MVIDTDTGLFREFELGDERLNYIASNMRDNEVIVIGKNVENVREVARRNLRQVHAERQQREQRRK
jgi:hypothetical protein